MGYFESRSFALAVLGVKEGYTLPELKRSYLKKAKIFHPDLGGTHDEFLRLQDAYEYLKAELTPNIMVNDVNFFTTNHEPQASKYVYTSLNSIFFSFFRSIISKILELFVVFFSNSNYLLKATVMQVIVFGTWLNYLLSNFSGVSAFNFFFELAVILIYIVIVLLLLLSLIALFHHKRLFVFLKFDRFSPKKLNLIRNFSVLFFAAATFPGYIIYISILIAFKLIGWLFKLIR